MNTAKDAPFVPQTKETYDDTDLVYVDVEGKKVVGLVEWTPADKPKKLAMPERVEKEGDRPRRGPRETRYYPWGTYRSMKRVYQLEGKVRKSDNSATLDEVLPKALEQAFWEQ